MMEEKNETAGAHEQYAAAYEAHYGEKDLKGALGLYTAIVADHPGTPEADYSQSQIQNIVNGVVPKKELLDAQLAMALEHLRKA
jgi:hypothetical protein